MAGPYGEIARGLKDIRVYPLTGNDVVGVGVDIPGIRTLDFGVDSDSDKLEGDDMIIAIARSAKTGSGSMELGRMSPEALVVILGGTIVTTGTSPAEIKTYEETSAASTVYCQITAQANSALGINSAYRVTIAKAMVTSGPNESLGQAAWNTPGIDFDFTQTSGGKFLTRAWYETGVAIV